MTVAKTFLREMLQYKCECGWEQHIPPNNAIYAEFLEIGTLHRVPKPASQKQCPKCRRWLSGVVLSWRGPDFPKIRKPGRKW